MIQAYWLSPKGTKIEISRTHIAGVIADPGQFGLDAEHIKKIYKAHKEPLGHEGYAREEIMLKLIKRGWVRIRKKLNS